MGITIPCEILGGRAGVTLAHRVEAMSDGGETGVRDRNPSQQRLEGLAP